jgi:hypothetical protein
MKLIYDTTKAPVNTGDVVHLSDGSAHIVYRVVEPHKPSSTGRVQLQSMCERKYYNEFYPSVIGATWIDREDR